MIEEVALRNWKTHRNTVLTFSKGVNVIYGVNGSGKTSLAEGISFAFFGGRYKGFIRRGESSARVTVRFSLGKHVFEVEREVSQRGSSAVLRRDGKGIEFFPETVTRRIEELLGMDKKMFERSVYGVQNGISSVYLLPPSERNAMYDRLLGIEELTRVREGLVYVRNRLNDERKGVNLLELEREREELKESLSSLEKTVKEKEEEIRRLESLIEERERERASIEERVREVEARVKRLRELEKEMERIRGEIESLEREGVEEGEEEELRSLYERNKSIWERVRSLEKELQVLQRSLEEEVRGVEEVREEIAKVTEELSSLRQRKEEIVRELSEVRGKVSRLKEIRERLRELEKRLEGITYEEVDVESVLRTLERVRKEVEILEMAVLWDKRCPVCLRPLTEEIALSIRERLSRGKEEVRELEEKVRELERRRREEEKKKVEKARLEREIEVLREELEGVEEVGEQDIERLERELEGVEKEVSLLENRLKGLYVELEKSRRRDEAAKRVKEIEEELEELSESADIGEDELEELKRKMERVRRFRVLLEKKNALARIEKELSLLEGSDRELEAIRDTYRKLSEDIASLRAKKDEMEKGLEVERRLLEEKRRKFLEIERRLEEVKRYTKIGEASAQMVVLWERLSREFRDALVGEINRALSTIWSSVYGSVYADYTDVRFLVREEKGKYVYSLEAKAPSGWVDVSTLSGGESTMAFLSLRLALSYVISAGTGFIILDEPTHNLDNNLTERFAQFLSDLTERGLFRQVIVITHNPVFSEYASGNVYHFLREKRGADVTRVEVI